MIFIQALRIRKVISIVPSLARISKILGNSRELFRLLYSKRVALKVKFGRWGSRKSFMVYIARVEEGFHPVARPPSISTTDVVSSENQKKITYAILSSECTLSKRVPGSHNSERLRGCMLYIWRDMGDRIATLTRERLFWFRIISFHCSALSRILFIILRKISSPITFYCIPEYSMRNAHEKGHKWESVHIPFHISQLYIS